MSCRQGIGRDDGNGQENRVEELWSSAGYVEEMAFSQPLPYHLLYAELLAKQHPFQK